MNKKKKKKDSLQSAIRDTLTSCSSGFEMGLSPSYVHYRPKTNAVILLDMGHTLWEEHVQEK
jgi:ribosomal protein L6P/L9E